MGIDFAASAGPTLGVEWEFGLVDKTTRDLVNAAREVFDGFAATHGEDPHLHHELLRESVHAPDAHTVEPVMLPASPRAAPLNEGCSSHPDVFARRFRSGLGVMSTTLAST